MKAASLNRDIDTTANQSIKPVSNTYLRAKRLLDIVLVLLFSMPALFIVGVSALIITIFSPGNPIFAHERVGLGGRVFRVYKLRSMHLDAERLLEEHLAANPEAKAEWEQYFKLKNDPRIIPYIGHFLRKSSMDELPQLWNVLWGDMSFVGPRPIVADEMVRYGDQLKYYLSVLPGVTGLWQVSGRNDTSYAERVALDVQYVKERTVWMDFGILVQTTKVIFDGKGAC